VETSAANEHPEAVEPLTATASPELTESPMATPPPEQVESPAARQLPEDTEPSMATDPPLFWLVVSAPAGDASRSRVTARLPRAIKAVAPVARVLVFMVLPSVCRDGS